jgi:two-component system, NtrC family, nitrogen regulation sensor histidine kinase NtrY
VFHVVHLCSPLSRKNFFPIYGFFRRRTLEQRLFIWLLGLALVPALLVLAAATWIGHGSLNWLGTLGPWTTVSESGRTLINAAQPAARRDTVLAQAVERHRSELAESLVQARRWNFLGTRVLAVLPVLLLLFTLALTLAALFISRRLARELSRPIQDLAAWTERIAQEQPLPPKLPAEAREVTEVQALRQSLRRAADELRLARERALQQERVRAWGEMARRVAHEMKNPLTPLRLAAHRLSALARDNIALSEPLRVVDEETARLEHLAREFSLLGRPAVGPRTPVDMAELMSSLLQTDVPASIETRLKAADSLPLVNADYNALQQALRNVLRNAVDAVQVVAEPRVDAELSLVEEGQRPFLRVALRDNGIGIPEELVHRVFEPDFTTKPRGTGLGLAIAQQNIAAHDGRIALQRRPVRGTEVIIHLPVLTLVESEPQRVIE